MLERGCIVRSKAGRDKDTYLVVVSVDGKNCYLCDGKKRPLERPKLKNSKHLAPTNWILNEEQLSTNKGLRQALKEFLEKSANQVGGD
ncbi:MAG TPA: hypothetical protein GXX17_03280 [Clostridiales bacterium]|nr:hypothetical protein [Clostridiales bacterium]